MHVTFVDPLNLTPAQLEAWASIQQSSALLASPFFRPEFTRAVARARSGVEVAVVQQAGEPALFFPYHRSGSVARPVAAGYSDYQGVIAASGAQWSMEELLRACRLSAWHFDHLVADQAELQPYHQVRSRSPIADLSSGFEAYREERRGETDQVVQTLRKARKIEREIAPLRFEQHTDDPRVLDQLIRWKEAQCLATGVPDGLKASWTLPMLREILTHRGKDFAGTLAALYIGDELAAAHLGLQCPGVFHSWIVGYNDEWSRFSPGLILLIRLMQSHQEMDFRILDFGKGEMPYKSSFMNGEVPLAEGSVDLRPVTRVLWRSWRVACDQIRNSPLRRVARIPWQRMRSARQWMTYR